MLDENQLWLIQSFTALEKKNIFRVSFDNKI